jgi:uncharacterized protein
VNQTSNRDAAYWIDRLGLAAHPEGGYYRVMYTAGLSLPQSALPAAFGGARHASTAIYFLLSGRDFSAFHRIRSDEVWHFYSGSALTVHVLGLDGQYSRLLLGSEPESGQVFQGVVTAGCWFGASLQNATSFALVGCTVAPGFDFADFQLAKRAELAALYPQHRPLIEQLTRQ